MSRARGFSILGAVAALAIIGIWIARNSDWVDTKVPIPLRGEALTNPFYAAQRFAEALGARTTSNRELDAPRSDSVIVLTSWQWSLTADRRVTLERWVEAGGRLVVDRTLFGDGAFEQWSGIGRVPRVGNTGRGRTTAVDGVVCPEFQLDDSGSGAGSARIRYHVCESNDTSSLATGKPASWTLRGVSGVLAARVQVGRGSVTAINARPFLYRSLFNGDHASLFVAATQLHRGDQVYFLSDGNHPSLVALAWMYGRPVVMLTLALIALALWRAMVRFGPLAALEPVARRSLAEQILGTGQFALRHGGGALHAVTVRALDEAARRRVPGFARLSDAERSGALARFTGVDRDSLAVARGSAGLQSHRLRSAIALLEATRRRMLPAHTRSRHGTG